MWRWKSKDGALLSPFLCMSTSEMAPTDACRNDSKHPILAAGVCVEYACSPALLLLVQTNDLSSTHTERRRTENVNVMKTLATHTYLHLHHVEASHLPSSKVVVWEVSPPLSLVRRAVAILQEAKPAGSNAGTGLSIKPPSSAGCRLSVSGPSGTEHVQRLGKHTLKRQARPYPQ